MKASQTGPGKLRERDPAWPRRRTVLERVLGGVVGAAFGGILTISLALSSAEWHPWFWTPVMLGFLVGLVYGDSGIRAVARVVGWGG